MSEQVKGTHDVFISYSTKNKNVADAVVSDFEQNGIKCWYAPRDILPGEEWVSAITSALENSRALVFIFTDESNNSRQVMNEIAMAFNAGLTIVPFKLTNEQMSSELEYYLTRVHWLDAVSKPLKKNIETLREYIEVILSASEAGTVNSPVKPSGRIKDDNDEKTRSNKTMVNISIAVLIFAVILFIAVLWIIGSVRRDGANLVSENMPPSDEIVEDARDAEQSEWKDPDALYYNTGKDKELEGDYASAFSYYQEGIEHGSLFSYLGMGNLYYDGLGVPMDSEKALEYYLKAGGFSEGDENTVFFRDKAGVDDEELFNRIGLIYFYDEDYEKAAYFFTLNADEYNSVNGMGNAALSYDRLGDSGNACLWYEKAIEAGHRDAESYKKRISELCK